MKQIRLNEQDITKTVMESVRAYLNENYFGESTKDPEMSWKEDEDEINPRDEWAEGENNFLMREKLPKGWEKIDSEDGEPIYRDGDFNEYKKDEYGHFMPIENSNDEDNIAAVPDSNSLFELKKRIKQMIRESFDPSMVIPHEELERGFDMGEGKHKGKKFAKAGAKRNSSSQKADNKRGTKRAIVLKWLKDKKNAVNGAEIMRQLWHPTTQGDEDTKRGEFYKKRDGKINKTSGAQYSFSDAEINALYRIKSGRS